MKTTGFILRIILIASIFNYNNSNAQALHWLSQPEIDIGLVTNGQSTFEAKISANGRFVTFSSSASNLVDNDNNHAMDVFIRDLQTGVTKLVTVTNSGNQATNGFLKAFSAPTSDGRYVAFASSASVFPGATNSGGDVYLYVKDLQTGAVVNHSDYNTNLHFEVFGKIALSDDGQYVTFDTYNQIDALHLDFNKQVYRKHLSTDNFELLSLSNDGLASANDSAELSDVSDNGRFVLIASKATNMTTDSINNTGKNLFIRDTLLNTNTLVNITPSGDNSSDNDVFTPNAAISNTGSVVFNSIQADLVNNDNNGRGDVFYFNNGVITRINLTANGNELTLGGTSNRVAISGDGSRIAFSEISDELFPAYTNTAFDLYSYETSSGTLSLISHTSTGAKANDNSLSPDLSTNGNRVVFSSLATDLTNDAVFSQNYNIYSYNFTSNTMKLATVASFTPNTILSDIHNPRTSSDQLSVIYQSDTPNLVAEALDDVTNDLFLLDRTTNTHSRIATKVDDGSDISPSGNYISFATQFLPPDGIIDLGATYVFLYNRTNDSYTLIEQGLHSRVNDNGVVAFQTTAGIDANDTNLINDLYVYDPTTSDVILISKDMTGNAASIYFFNGFDIGGKNNNIWVTFSSDNSNIVPNDNNSAYDVFIKKLPNGSISRVTEFISGVEANGSSTSHSISDDGNWVAFQTLATNLTLDDYSQAYLEQIILFDRINHQYSLVSKNDAGLPLSAQGTSTITFPDVSNSGRYVSYRFTDDSYTAIVEFAGDTDNRDDIILFDKTSQTASIVSKHVNGIQSNDDTNTRSQVVEDLSVSPPLVGVLFTASGGDLTELANHPGNRHEAFLYQQGGPDITLTINIQGGGAVIGNAGINCSNVSCTYNFPIGTELTLIAVPNTNMQFVTWQVDFGNCNDNTNPCHLIVDREKTLTATFIDPSDIIFANGFE